MSVISESITKMTAENQQLKIRTQSLETQRNNLPEHIQNMVTVRDEQSMS